MTLGLARGATTKQPRLFLSKHSGRQQQATSNQQPATEKVSFAPPRLCGSSNFQTLNFQTLNF